MQAQFLASATVSIFINVWVMLQVVVFFPNPKLRAWCASACRGNRLRSVVTGNGRRGIGIAGMASWLLLLRSRKRRSSTDDEDGGSESLATSHRSHRRHLSTSARGVELSGDGASASVVVRGHEDVVHNAAVTLQEEVPGTMDDSEPSPPSPT